MKLYATGDTEFNGSVEVLLNHQELSNLISTLAAFEDKIVQFKLKAQNKDGLGFTHLHLKDCGLMDGSDKSDIVFYVNLSEE